MQRMIAVIDWDGRLDEARRRVARGVPDGSTVAGVHGGTAWAIAGGSAETVVRRAGLVLAGDVRLDDEGALRHALGTDTHRGLELVGLAFERWGARLAERLLGDFAFVVLDLSKRVALAVRDRFGVRPLAHRTFGGADAFAGAPAHLAAISETRPAIDDASVAEYLDGREPPCSATFFEGITRVPGGHTLRVCRDRATSERYWFPPRETAAGSRQTRLFELRRLFEAAIAARTPAAPVITLVSGGLDSSSIACVAHGLAAAPLTLATGHFAEASERAFADSVATHLGRRIELLETRPTPEIDDPLDPSHPSRYPLAAMTRAVTELARSIGARVVFSGVGGDELLFERGVFRDLARSGRWITLYREASLATRYSTRSRRFHLDDAVRWLVPRALARPLGAMRRRL
ncbi:MAG TPA: asparagine synthase-related protein, partial [Gaiellaceae bacterium]|nr:asparagine synthase-related protein [Gaiellaceae bacterium]